MPLMTGDEYVRSLQKIKMKIFLFGEEIDNPVGNPILQPAVNSVKATYDLAQNPEYADLMTATSNLTGEKINRFTHIHQSSDDLVKKVKMQRLLGQKTAACFQRCVGMDSFNSVYSTTYEVDKNGYTISQTLCGCPEEGKSGEKKDAGAGVLPDRA